MHRAVDVTAGCLLEAWAVELSEALCFNFSAGRSGWGHCLVFKSIETTFNDQGFSHVTGSKSFFCKLK